MGIADAACLWIGRLFSVACLASVAYVAFAVQRHNRECRRRALVESMRNHPTSYRAPEPDDVLYDQTIDDPNFIQWEAELTQGGAA